jgi:hypothetical protein
MHSAIHTYTYIHTHTHTYIHTYNRRRHGQCSQRYTHTHTHTHKHTQTHTHTHTHMHTVAGDTDVRSAITLANELVAQGLNGQSPLRKAVVSRFCIDARVLLGTEIAHTHSLFRKMVEHLTEENARLRIDLDAQREDMAELEGVSICVSVCLCVCVCVCAQTYTSNTCMHACMQTHQIHTYIHTASPYGYI